MKTLVNVVQIVAIGLVAFTVVMMFANEPAGVRVASGDYSDEELIQIEAGGGVFEDQCAGCHGVDGSGGIGPALQGVEDRLSVDEQIAVVTNGRGGMPGFAGRVTDQNIAAVVFYTREVL